APVAGTDVATKDYVDTAPDNDNQDLANVLGNGNDAGGFTITNAGAPVAGTDVATKDYVDTAPDNDNQDLANVLGNGNDAGNVSITNLLDPSNAQDAATKNYVDTELASGALNAGNGVTNNAGNLDLGGTLSAPATITTTSTGALDLIVNGDGALLANTETTSITSATTNLGNAAGDNINIVGSVSISEDIRFNETTNDLTLQVNDQVSGPGTLIFPDLAGNTETIALSSDVLSFPISETTADVGPILDISHTGGGVTLDVVNNSAIAGDYVIRGESTNNSIAGYFVNNNTSSTNQALYAHTRGSAPSFVAFGFGTGPAARFSINSAAGNSAFAMTADNQEDGGAGEFVVTNGSNTAPAVRIDHQGAGVALELLGGDVLFNRPTENLTIRVTDQTFGGGSTLVIPPLPSATETIALQSDLATAGLWTAAAPDIYFNTGDVGIGTINPGASLQIGDEFIFDRLVVNSETIDADIIASNARLDKSTPTENEIFRVNAGQASVISLEQGNIAFLRAVNDAAGTQIDPSADIVPWMQMEDDGSISVVGQANFAQDLSFDQGLNHTIAVEDASTGAGRDLSLGAADGEPGLGDGGNLNLLAGEGFDFGGNVTISAGNATNASGAGGDIELNPGNAGNPDGRGLVRIQTTSALLLPTGTDGERPVSGVAQGMIRYNESTDVFEGYVDDGTPAWEQLSGGTGLDLTATTTDIEFVSGANRSISVASNAAGGNSLSISAGLGGTAGGGALNLNGGGSTTSGGGAVNLTAGGGPGNGANVNITASNAGSGDGGVIDLKAGNGTGGGANGGDISLEAGLGTSSGGDILLTPGSGAVVGQIDLNGPTVINSIVSDINFDRTSRRIGIANTTTGAGGGLTLAAGATTTGTAGPGGGDLSLEAGDSQNGGGGSVVLAAGNTAAGTPFVGGNVEVIPGTGASEAEAGFVDILSTSALKVPVGTTGQRIGAGRELPGMIRYNSSLSTYEGWDGASWLNLAATGTSFTFSSYNDAQNFRIGQGSSIFTEADPNFLFEVVPTASTGVATVSASSFENFSQFNLKSANGFMGSESPSQAGEVLGRISFQGFGDSFYRESAFIQATALDGFTDGGEVGTSISFHTARPGSPSTEEVMRVTNGEIVFAEGAPRAIRVEASSGAAGDDLTIEAGDFGGGGQGGSLDFNAGLGESGGDVVINGGQGVSTTGGNITLTAGNGAGPNDNGVIILNSGLVSTPSAPFPASQLSSELPPQKIIRLEADSDVSNILAAQSGREIVLIIIIGSGNQIMPGPSLQLNENIPFIMDTGTTLHLVYMDAPLDRWVEISRTRP
ncbi:MAG: hypothetical protein AAF616_12520, partial [Bacteroidota bacterium]